MKRNLKQQAYDKGHAAERLAAAYFRLRGYKIVKMRYKTPVGEIDLIVRRGSRIVFVEVKSRDAMASALEAVTAKNQARVAQAAQYFIAANPAFGGFEMRFDVIVTGRPFYWRHLDNAWQGRT